MPLTPEAIYDTVRYRCSVSVLKRIGVRRAPQNAKRYMVEGLVYSPKEKIPLFKLMCNSSGDRLVEYLNNRTGCTELIKVSRLLVYLLEVEMASKNQKIMIYSPKKRIPLGIMECDRKGVYFIEVKYKKNKERIRFTTYVSLLLESEVLKAS